MEINTAADLNAAILRLEHKKVLLTDQVTDQFHEAVESLKPINLLKSSLSKVVHSPGLVEKIINSTVGLGAGVLSKKLLIGKSTGIVKKILGTVLELGVAGIIAKKSSDIKSTGAGFFSKLFSAKPKRVL